MAKIILYFIVMFSVNLVAQSTEIQYLSGTSATETVDWDFYCSAGMNSGKWTSIPVPSCWEQHSFGQYNYGSVPFEERLKETGTYKRNFEVPENWESKEVKIVFEGVMTDAEVKINGNSVGPSHQGAFYQFAYDITEFLEYGRQNSIEVLVHKFSDNESINQAERKSDFWVFGGIFRPVYLEAKPVQNIQRVAINAKADGTFESEVFTSNEEEGEMIEVEIQTTEGLSVATFSSGTEAASSLISGAVENPKLWNPESPNMYQAVFKLKSANQTVHQYIEKFAFRTVEVKESDGIYVNGVRVKLKGVNRHTFHPDYARTSSKALSIEAVNLMKEMNMNSVRMSHYPPEKHFLDVCDSLGLFVLDELAGWQTPAYDENIGRKLLKEMIARDVNHPSIILWDNGNEGGWNDALNDDFAKLDIQKRTLIHPWQNFEKTNTIHYVDYNYLSLDGYGRRKIFFPTELMHGLYDGGHGAGLEDFWLRIWNHPLAAGAFLWVFADEGIARTDRGGALDFDGNHAPDGILGPRMEKEASFYTIKKIWSPIFIEKKYITPQFDGTFNIENRYHYTNLDQCIFNVEWMSYGENESLISNFSQEITTELKPGQKGQLKITLPNNWRENHILKISGKDEKGNLITEWSYPVQRAFDNSKEILTNGVESDVVLSEDDHEYLVTVYELSYTFNKNTGLLTMVTKGENVIPLKDGPVFVSREKLVERVSAVQLLDGTVAISSIYADQRDSVTWKIQKNGLLDLKVAYEPANNAPNAGITFSFPEDNVSSMKWMGQGPYRVWKNRNLGSSFGVWEKQYNQTITGHSIFKYPEFKGYHAETHWAEVNTRNTAGFKVYIKSDDVFLRMLTPDQSSDGRTTTVDFPSGNISFLHGINAIGTKFKEASRLGPQSSNYSFNPQKYHGRKLKMHLVFDFGINK